MSSFGITQFHACYFAHEFTKRCPSDSVQKTQHLTREQLTQLNDEVGPGRSLLICCSSFRGKPENYPHLELRKIPKAVLSKCEWGHDDYSLKVENLPKAPPPTDRRGQQSLFGEEVGK